MMSFIICTLHVTLSKRWSQGSWDGRRVWHAWGK